MADIADLRWLHPENAPSCLNCIHASFGRGGTTCGLVGEPVYDETAMALTCESYEHEEST